MPFALAFFNWQRLLLWGLALASLLAAGVLAVLTLGTSIRLAQDPIPGTGRQGIGEINSSCVAMPELWEAMFNGAARKYKIRVALLVARAEAESGLTTGAVSPVGARGVMQIMPETWDEIWANPRFDRTTIDGRTLSPDDPFEVEPGLYAGAFYLGQQIDDFNREDYALAAYNAGAAAVEGYEKGVKVRPRGIPPYVETEQYVAKILARAETITSCLAQLEQSTNQSEGRIFLHWTHTDSGDPLTDQPKFHVVVFQNGESKSFASPANATRGRPGAKNFAVAVVGMKGITSVGQYTNLKGEGGQTLAPITDAQLATFVKEVAVLAKREGIPIDDQHILSEAEAASLMDYPAEKVKALMDLKTGGNRAKKSRDLGLPHNNYGPYLGPHVEKSRDPEALNPKGDPGAIDFFMAEDELRALIQAEYQKLGG